MAYTANTCEGFLSSLAFRWVPVEKHHTKHCMCKEKIVKPYVNASEIKRLLGPGLRHTAVCTGVLCGFMIPIHYKCISHLCIYTCGTVIVSSLTDKQIGIGQ